MNRKVSVREIKDFWKRCVGCGSCVQTCPVKAIKMKPTKNTGFIYPEVNKDCIRCGKCLSSCPIVNTSHLSGGFTEQQQCYLLAGDDEVRRISSSGGVFPIIARRFIQDGGFVCGVRWSSDYRYAYHEIVSDTEHLSDLFFSKYVQADTKQSYSTIENLLKAGSKVLFCGTPCQVDGLCCYLRHEYTELYTIDLLCHGVPSPLAWKKYISEIELIYNGKVSSVQHRPKQFGWKVPCYVITLNNNLEIRDNTFRRSFLGLWMLRVCCDRCKYAQKNRVGDITIGDAWLNRFVNPQANDNKGRSAVIVNSWKGYELLGIAANGAVHCERISTESSQKFKSPVINGGYKSSIHRETFFKRLGKHENFRDITNSIIKNPLQVKAFGLRRKTDKPFKGKVGIVCHRAHGNFGGIATIVAVITLIESLGYQCTIINLPEEYPKSRYYNSFLDANFALHTVLPKGKMSELNEEYDAFVVTPGQIWQYWFTRIAGMQFYLDFADSTKVKKISFGSSFGSDQFKIPQEKYDAVAKLLRDFHHVSVREQSGVSICKNMGVDAKHINDPVFYLDADFWQSVANAKTREKKISPYILSYILGPNEEKLNNVLDMSRNLELGIRALDCNDPKKKMPLYTDLGLEKVLNLKADVCDWLYLILNAKYVITDSFHATCFSLIFNKDFVVFKRGNMNTRLESLLEPLGLINRLVDGTKPLDFGLPDIDWQAVNASIQEWKTDAIQWLENALGSSTESALYDEKVR